MNCLRFAKGARLALSSVLALAFHSGCMPSSYNVNPGGSDNQRTTVDWLSPGPSARPSEAPAGFDGQTNCFLAQEEFDDALKSFEVREGIAEGLGSVYNA